MKKLAITISAICLISSLFVPHCFSQQINVGATTIKTLTLAATQYSVSLGRGIKSFSVQCRTASDIKFGLADGIVEGTTYYTIKSGIIYYSPMINSKVTIYLSTLDAGAVVEIEYWR